MLVNSIFAEPPAPTVTVAIDSKAVDDKYDPQPYPFTLPIESSIGLTRSPYANFVWLASTVYVADPVLIMLKTYASILDALPEDGAVPPCHFGVTDAPSI